MLVLWPEWHFHHAAGCAKVWGPVTQVLRLRLATGASSGSSSVRVRKDCIGYFPLTAVTKAGLFWLTVSGATVHLAEQAWQWEYMVARHFESTVRKLNGSCSPSSVFLFSQSETPAPTMMPPISLSLNTHEQIPPMVASLQLWYFLIQSHRPSTLIIADTHLWKQRQSSVAAERRSKVKRYGQPLESGKARKYIPSHHPGNLWRRAVPMIPWLWPSAVDFYVLTCRTVR